MLKDSDLNYDLLHSSNKTADETNSTPVSSENGLNLFARFKQAEPQLSLVHTPPRTEQRGLTTRWGGQGGQGEGGATL